MTHSSMHQDGDPRLLNLVIRCRIIVNTSIRQPRLIDLYLCTYLKKNWNRDAKMFEKHIIVCSKSVVPSHYQPLVGRRSYMYNWVKRHRAENKTQLETTCMYQHHDADCSCSPLYKLPQTRLGGPRVGFRPSTLWLDVRMWSSNELEAGTLKRIARPHRLQRCRDSLAAVTSRLWSSTKMKRNDRPKKLKLLWTP